MVLCDRRVKRPSQVWERCVFADLPDWAAVAPYHQRAQTFKDCFRGYLFGSGTPQIPPGQHSEEGPANPTIPANVLCSCVVLAALTESEDLPADPDYRIKVRRFTHVHWRQLTPSSSIGCGLPRPAYQRWGFIRAAAQSTSSSHRNLKIL